MPVFNEKENENSLALSREDAKKIADRFRKDGGKDPFADTIPPALLSAEHITKYAMTTGMIAPFDGDHRASALKKASYECRIGERAFRYDKNDCLCPINVNDKQGLIVEANSIVFVETEIDFHLPDFIAMRLNLRIRHVHRGLLLGTGPPLSIRDIEGNYVFRFIILPTESILSH